MLYGHLYQLRWGDNVKVESRYSLSLFNALKYSWTLGHNPKVVSALDLLSFRFYTIEEYMATISMQLDKKTPITCKKNRLWGVGCVSLLFHMPYAIISQDVANEFRRKQRPKCNMLVKNEPTKDPSTRRMNTQRYKIHTHTDTQTYLSLKNVQPKTEEFSTLNLFLFSSLHFCFVLTRLRTRGQYEIEIAFGIWSADRQRIKIYLSSNSEPQIISVRCTRHFHFDCKRAQLIEFLGFISYVNDAPRKCGERPHSNVCD